MATGGAKYATLVAVAAAAGGFLFGGDTSMLNGAITGVATTLDLSPSAVGFVAAIGLIGSAVGAWFAGPVTARVGRTRVMGIAGASIAAGSLSASFADGVVVLGISRVLVGLGIGAASAVVPSYIGEISPTGLRGRLGSMWQFAIVIGQLVGLLGGFGLTALAGGEAAPLWPGGAAWRWMFATVAISAALYVVVARGLPRSPNDLVRQGHEDRARALLARIGGDPVEQRIADIRRAQSGQMRPATLGDLRGSLAGLKPVVWTGILLAVFQQLLGISVVKTYSNTLWQTVGFSTETAFVTSIITVGVSVLATVIAISIIDKVPRRTMLGVGAAVSALALGVLAVCFSTAMEGPDGLEIGGTAGPVALVAMNVFSLAFGVTWGPVMWVMLAELFDDNLRVSAVAVCTALNWTFNWLVTRTFPLLAGWGLEFAYGAYTVFAVLALIFVIKVLPETRGQEMS